MPNPATPDPDSVTLPAWSVRLLRNYLARASDFDNLSAGERADVRTEMCGLLAALLDGECR